MTSAPPSENVSRCHHGRFPHPAVSQGARGIRSALCATFTVIALSICGCGAIAESRKADALDAALSSYRTAIRWGHYELAYGLVAPDHRKGMPANIKDVEVTSYEVVQPPLIGKSDTATEIVHLQYVLRDTQRVQALTDRQLWRYDPKDNRWWLESGLPDFE